MSRDEIERWLRLDLNKAQDAFNKATPAEKPAAYEHLRQALDAFTAFVLRGEVPNALRRELPKARSGGSNEHKTAA